MLRFLRLTTLGLVILTTLCVLLPHVWAAEREREQKHRRRTCPEQKPQKFLIRSNFVKHGSLNEAAHERAVRYRAEQYGNVVGLGLERYNPKKAYSSAL